MRRTISRPSLLGLRRIGTLCLSVLTFMLAASAGLASGAPPLAHANAAPAYTVTDLGTLPAGSDSFATGINASGQVVGYSYTRFYDTGSAHAFRTTATGTIDAASDLGTLPGGSDSSATGINASGQVVGHSQTSGGAQHAFLYDDSATPHMRDLNSLIPSGSGVTLTDARGINDLGQIAVNGFINGQPHAFRLTPTPSSSSSCTQPASFSSAPVPSDEVFCGQPPTPNAYSVSVDITRYYGSICPDPNPNVPLDRSDPYAVDPADCQNRQSGPLLPHVIGTGVAATAFVDVATDSNFVLQTSVLVNGHQASGVWLPTPTGMEYVGTIPTSDLWFPNLHLTPGQVQPPYAASNTIVAGVHIRSATLQITGTRPVILVHGIAQPQITFDLLNIFKGKTPQVPVDAPTLNGWSTWDHWLTALNQPQDMVIDEGPGYLRRIGVPNIRPNEENDATNTGSVICSNSWTGSKADGACDAPCDVLPNFESEPWTPTLLSCAFPSDARAYLWAYADYNINKLFLLRMAHMLQVRYGVQQINIVAHSKGTQDTEAAVAMDPGVFSGVVLQAPMYIGTDLADKVAATLSHILSHPPCDANYRQGCVNASIYNAAHVIETLGQPTLTQLSRSYWKRLGHGLLDHLTSAPPVDAVAGTDGCSMLSGKLSEWAFRAQCPGDDGPHVIPNDGAVPVYSVDAVPKATLYHFHLDHTDMNKWTAVYAKTCPLLRLPGSEAPCPVYMDLSGSSARSAAARAADDPLPVPAASGPVNVLALDVNQTSRTTIAVPPSSSMTLSLLSGGPATMSLLDQRGQPVDNKATTVAYTSTTQPDGSTLTSYTLSQPTVGTWTAVITNTSATSSTVGVLTSDFVTPLTLDGGAPLTAAPGATLPLTASLVDGASPVVGATVTATVFISGVPPLDTTLIDNGDGSYAGSLTLPVTATGTASIAVEASGTTGGAPFDLVSNTSSQVGSGQAVVGTTFGEQAVVNSDDSLFNALLITPTLTVSRTGSYEVSADLTDGSGSPVASSTAVVTLTADVATSSTLSFDGASIYNSNEAPPQTDEIYTTQKLDSIATSSRVQDI